MPSVVYHSYGFRTKCPTFEVPKYLYSKGHQPTYDDYLKAVSSEDVEYVDWLKKIRCHGTYENTIMPPADQIEHILLYSVTPSDFSWLLRVIIDHHLPDMELETHHNLIRFLPELIQYVNTHDPNQLDYLFEYLGHHSKDILENIFKTLTDSGLSDSIMIKYLTLTQPDELDLAYIYLYVLTNGDEDEDEADTDHPDGSSESILLNYLTNNIKWNYVFLAEINQWIMQEGSYQPSEFMTLINDLWDQYEDKIDVLKDQVNKDKWNHLVENDAWKCEMHEFLGDLLKW